MFQQREVKSHTAVATVEDAVKSAKQFLCAAMLAVCQQTSTLSSAAPLLITIELLQALSLLLNLHPGLPWASDNHWAMRPLGKWLQTLAVTTADISHGEVRF